MCADMTSERVNDTHRTKKSKPKKKKKDRTRRKDEKNGQARQRRRVRKYHKKRYRKDRAMALGWRGLEVKPTDWPKVVEGGLDPTEKGGIDLRGTVYTPPEKRPQLDPQDRRAILRRKQERARSREEGFLQTAPCLTRCGATEQNYQEGTGSLVDHKSQERREVEGLRPLSINTLHSVARRTHPKEWADTTTGGKRDGLLQMAATRAQAQATRISQILARAVPLSAQGKGARLTVRPAAPPRPNNGARLNSMEFCAGEMATVSEAEALGKLICPRLLVELEPWVREELRRRFPGADIANEAWEISEDRIRALRILVMHASTPCIHFSQAGNQRGMQESESNLIQKYFELVNAADDGKGALMFSYENVKELADHFEGGRFERYVQETMPRHHISVGMIQAATTKDPKVPGGEALVSHVRLWVFGVRKDLFLRPVEVGDLEQCPPRPNFLEALERDGERSSHYHFLPKVDQEHWIERNKVIHPTTAPYYVKAEIADPPKGNIGTGGFSRRVIDPSKGLCYTLTSGSWPWILDEIEGVPVVRQLTHREAHQIYALRTDWGGVIPEVDSEGTRRSVSQCVPGNVAHARTQALEDAWVRKDETGKSPADRYESGERLGPPQEEIQASVGRVCSPTGRAVVQDPVDPLGWSPLLDTLPLKNPYHRAEPVCVRYQYGACSRGPACSQAHVCHVCLVQHVRNAECEEAQLWRAAAEREVLEQGPTAKPPGRLKRLKTRAGLLDPAVRTWAATYVQQLNCVSTTPKGLAEAIGRRWPQANVYAKRRSQPGNPHYAQCEHWDNPGTISVHPPVRRDDPAIINVYGQFDKGGPRGLKASSLAFPRQVYDTRRQREGWFWSALDEIAALPERPTTLAFPHKIGCCFGGGEWEAYEAMLERFATNNPDITVYVVEQCAEAPDLPRCTADVEAEGLLRREDLWCWCQHGVVHLCGTKGSLPPKEEGEDSPKECKGWVCVKRARRCWEDSQGTDLPEAVQCAARQCGPADDTTEMEEKKIFVSQLPASVEALALRKYFGKFGAVARVRLVSKKTPLGGKWTARWVLEYSESQAVQTVLGQTHQLGGQTVVVTPVPKRPEPPPTPRPAIPTAWKDLDLSKETLTMITRQLWELTRLVGQPIPACWSKKLKNQKNWDLLQNNGRFMLKCLAQGPLRCHYCANDPRPLPIYTWQEATNMTQAEKVLRRMATVDHVIPRSKGGSNDDDNLVIACYGCNYLKADQVLDNPVLTLPEGSETTEGRKQAAKTALQELQRLLIAGEGAGAHPSQPAVPDDLSAPTLEQKASAGTQTKSQTSKNIQWTQIQRGRQAELSAQVSAGCAALQEGQQDPRLVAEEELGPCLEGKGGGEPPERREVRVIPCAMMANPNGEMEAHAAVWVRGENQFQLLGRELEDPMTRGLETPKQVLTKELLTVAPSGAEMVDRIGRWLEVAKPSLARYASEKRTTEVSVWAIMTPEPLQLLARPAGWEFKYLPVAEIKAEPDSWEDGVLGQVVSHELKRAAHRCIKLHPMAGWREAMSPSGGGSRPTCEGVVLVPTTGKMGCGVLVAGSPKEGDGHLRCPLHQDVRVWEAEQELMGLGSRLQDLKRKVDFTAQLAEGHPEVHVYGGLLTEGAARPVVLEGRAEAAIRPLCLMEFLRTDEGWRRQWADPHQLLRMQVVAMEVYLASLGIAALPTPARWGQQLFEAAQTEVDRERERWCWVDEDQPSEHAKARRYLGGTEAIRMFSHHHKRVRAVAQTRMKITIPRESTALVTLQLHDKFGGEQSIPRPKEPGGVYLVTSNPQACAQHGVMVQIGIIEGGRRRVEVKVTNFGRQPTTIPAGTILGLIGEECQVEAWESNRLVQTYATYLEEAQGVDLKQYETEAQYADPEMVHFIRQTMKEVWPRGVPLLSRTGGEPEMMWHEAEAIVDGYRTNPPEEGSTGEAVVRQVQRLLEGDLEAPKWLAARALAQSPEAAGATAELKMQWAHTHFRGRRLGTPSWCGRKIAWGEAFEAPADELACRGLQDRLKNLADKAYKEKPQSFVCLLWDSVRTRKAMAPLWRRGFRRIPGRPDRLPQDQAWLEGRHQGKHQCPTDLPEALPPGGAASKNSKRRRYRRRRHREIIRRPGELFMMEWKPSQPGGPACERKDEIRADFHTCEDRKVAETHREKLIELAKTRISDDQTLNPEQNQQMLDLLLEYLPHLDPDNLGRTSYGGKFKIDTGDASPVRVVPWRASPHEREVIRAEIAKMLRLGVIQPSKSPWTTIPVLVKKGDNSYRFAIDYRGLNKVTKFDASPLPRVDDTIAGLAGKRYFSLADMNSGFWQMEVEEDSIEKTAFVTQEGCWEFTVLPFGLKNAPAAWQRMVNTVLQGYLYQFAFMYIDDLVVASATWEEHLGHLRQVLERFRLAGLTLKLTKCRFGVSSLRFLGHIVTGDDIRPDPSKTASIRAFKLPTTLREVRQWLGLCNWYRRFIKGFAVIAAPWVELTKKENHGLIQEKAQSEECRKSFEQLKDALCGPEVMLLQPDYGRPFRVETDASDYQIGAVLTQQHAATGDWKPVEYMSRHLTAAEYGQRQTPSYLEAIAIFEATRRWRIYLADKQFEVVTDHQPLAALPERKFALDRLTRIQLALQQYNYQVVYRQGADHEVADAMSRIPVTVTEPGPDPLDDIPICPPRTLEQYLQEHRDCGEDSESRATPKMGKEAEEPVLEFTLRGGAVTHGPSGEKERQCCQSVQCAAYYTRSAKSAQQAREQHLAETEVVEVPMEVTGRYKGRRIRKRFGASIYLGNVVSENLEDGLFRVSYPADGEVEELTEEELLAVLLPEDVNQWPQPTLAGVAEGEEPLKPAMGGEWKPRDSPEEGLETRVITPCRILPGYTPQEDPELQRHRYLAVPNDEELIRAQEEDPWCARVKRNLLELQTSGGVLEEDPTEEQMASRLQAYHELADCGLRTPEVDRWYVCATTGVVMRRGFVRENKLKRKSKRLRAEAPMEEGVGEPVPGCPPPGQDLQEEERARRQNLRGIRVVPQRIIPLALRANLLYFYHGHPLAGHKGIRRVMEELALKVWWPRVMADIKRHIMGCACAKGYRELRQPRPKMVRSLLSEGPAFGQHLSVDTSARGPETRRGNAAFLVIVDTHSLYTKVVPLPVVNALEVARALIEEWFMTFGLPVTLHSDGGSEFVNALLHNIAKQLKVTRTHISPGNPSGNTLAENAVKKMKTQVKEMIGGHFDTWDQYASSIAWTYNMSWNPRTGMIPAAVAFGQLPRGIIDLAMPGLVEERDSNGQPREAWTNYRTQLMDVIEKANLWVRRSNEEELRKKVQALEEAKFGYQVQQYDSVWYYSPVVRSRIQRQRPYLNCWRGPYLVDHVSQTGNTAVLRMEGGTKLKSVNVTFLRQYRTPLMSTYGASTRVLAARPVGILSHRQIEEDGHSQHYYLVQLHSTTEFQEWVPANLLPGHMVLEWWRLLDQNRHLQDYQVGADVTVLMPYHRRRLLQGEIVGKVDNLLTIQVGGGEEVEAYITNEGVVRSAETTTEDQGNQRDAETKSRANRRRDGVGGRPWDRPEEPRVQPPELVGVVLDRILEDTGKAEGAKKRNESIIRRCADINGSTFQQLQERGYQYRTNKGVLKNYEKTDLRYDLTTGYLKYQAGGLGGTDRDPEGEVGEDEDRGDDHNPGLDDESVLLEEVVHSMYVSADVTQATHTGTDPSPLGSLDMDRDWKDGGGRGIQRPPVPLRWAYRSPAAKGKEKARRQVNESRRACWTDMGLSALSQLRSWQRQLLTPMETLSEGESLD